MSVLVVFFGVTFFMMTVGATPNVLPPQYDIDVIVLDDDEDLIPRPMLDPDFESDLREYCKYEDIDTSHLDNKEE
jgi:hypothetical protein